MNAKTDASFGLLRPGARCALALIIMITAVPRICAEVPPRFYWKTLSGLNAVPLIGMSVDGNANPLDRSHHVVPGADIEADMFIAGYAKILPIFDRSAMVAALVPMGEISSEVNVAGVSSSESAQGYGDPMLELNINLIGPAAINSLPDLMRYEPGFSADLVVDLAFPIGEYDEHKSINIGQNRWYGRIGFPLIQQIGPWVPGKRTTLEVFPSVWLFGDNDNFGEKKLESDPSFELDLHLTRDLSSDLWGSLDTVIMQGGKSKIDGVSGDSVDALLLGFTFGYQLTDSLQLTFGYKATLDDDSGSESTELEASTVTISLISGWHSLLEGVKRLGDSE